MPQAKMNAGYFYAPYVPLDGEFMPGEPLLKRYDSKQEEFPLGAFVVVHDVPLHHETMTNDIWMSSRCGVISSHRNRHIWVEITLPSGEQIEFTPDEDNITIVRFPT